MVRIQGNNITTLEPYRGEPIVELFECEYITDISPIAGAGNINIACCHNIADFSPLKGAETVYIQDCNQPINLPPLEANRVLIRNCPQFADVSMLAGVKQHVTLSQCGLVTDISPLAGVKSLNISSCKNIIDLSPLKGTIRELSIYNCDQFTDADLALFEKTARVTRIHDSCINY